MAHEKEAERDRVFAWKDGGATIEIRLAGDLLRWFPRWFPELVPDENDGVRTDPPQVPAQREQEFLVDGERQSDSAMADPAPDGSATANDAVRLK